MVIGWEFLLFGLGPCREPPYYFETALATFTVTVAVWVSTLRVDGTSGWRKTLFTAWGTLYDLFLLLFIVIVFALPIFIFQPTYQCYNDRAKVAELVFSASQSSDEIEERYEARKTLKDVGTGLAIPISGRVRYGLVTSDGVAIAVGDDPPAIAILTPNIEGDRFSWKCLVFPTKSAPGMCRQRQ